MGVVHVCKPLYAQQSLAQGPILYTSFQEVLRVKGRVVDGRKYIYVSPRSFVLFYQVPDAMYPWHSLLEVY